MQSFRTIDPIHGDSATLDTVRDAVLDLVYQFGLLPIYWRDHSQWLSGWLTRTEELLFPKRHDAIEELRLRLSSIYNHEKADLSAEQLERLTFALRRAYTLANRYQDAIPEELEAHERQMQAVKKSIGKRTASNGQPADDPSPQYVTLDQIAARVNRSKKALEKKLNKPNSTMPKPDVEGGGGKPHEWIWANIRPWLETEFGKKLPQTLPNRRADGN